MRTPGVTESVVEDAALAWLENLGYAVLHGPDISPGGDTLTLALSQREREHYSDVVLERRLRQALVHLNPDPPHEALEDAFRKLTRFEAPTLIERNRAVHHRRVDLAEPMAALRWVQVLDDRNANQDPRRDPAHAF